MLFAHYYSMQYKYLLLILQFVVIQKVDLSNIFSVCHAISISQNYFFNNWLRPGRPVAPPLIYAHISVRVRLLTACLILTQWVASVRTRKPNTYNNFYCVYATWYKCFFPFRTSDSTTTSMCSLDTKREHFYACPSRILTVMS